jgi:hypothetical protein
LRLRAERQLKAARRDFPWTLRSGSPLARRERALRLLDGGARSVRRLCAHRDEEIAR